MLTQLAKRKRKRGSTKKGRHLVTPSSVRFPFDRTRLLKDIPRFPLSFLTSFQQKRVASILHSQKTSEDFRGNPRISFCFLCGKYSFHEEDGVNDGSMIHACLFYPDEFHGYTSYCGSCVRDFRIPTLDPSSRDYHLEIGDDPTTTLEDCIRCQFQYWTVLRTLESVCGIPIPLGMNVVLSYLSKDKAFWGSTTNLQTEYWQLDRFDPMTRIVDYQNVTLVMEKESRVRVLRKDV